MLVHSLSLSLFLSFRDFFFLATSSTLSSPILCRQLCSHGLPDGGAAEGGSRSPWISAPERRVDSRSNVRHFLLIVACSRNNRGKGNKENSCSCSCVPILLFNLSHPFWFVISLNKRKKAQPVLPVLVSHFTRNMKITIQRKKERTNPLYKRLSIDRALCKWGAQCRSNLIIWIVLYLAHVGRPIILNRYTVA